MKRLLALLLAATLLLGAIACGDDSGKTGQTEVEATEAPTEVPSPTAVPTPTEVPSPTPEPTPEPTKSPADLWAELSDRYPALLCATSQRTLRNYVYDPSAFGIDPKELIPIGFGSVEDCNAYYNTLQALLDRVGAIDRETLDEEDRFSYDTVVESLQTELACREFLLLSDPFTPTTGVHCDLPLVFATSRIESADDIEAYLEEVEYIPVFIDKLLERQKACAENGHFMTESALDSTLDEIDSIRKSGKHFFGYAFLGKRMKLMHMSEEEQAPYLARNQKAIDDVIAAYDKLYTELDGMRPFCDNALTPYQDLQNAKESEHYRYYNTVLSQFFGKADPNAAQKVFLMYNEAISYLEKEFSEIVFPKDFSEQMANYMPRLTEAMFDETTALLEKEFTPLTQKFAVDYLPGQDTPYFGLIRLHYYYDRPERSVMYFNPKADSASVAVRYLACNNYFYRYFSQNPEIDRAQLFAAPDSYFSGLGFYNVLTLTADEAKRTGNYAEYYTIFMIIYNAMMAGYTTSLIELGYSADEIKNHLRTSFSIPDDVVDYFYTEARSDPNSMIELSIGYAQLITLRESCRTKLRGRMNDRQFLKQYLSYGPSFHNLLEEKMEAWCETMLGSGNA